MDVLGRVKFADFEAVLTPKGWQCDDEAFARYLTIEFPPGPGYLPHPWREPLEACAKVFGGEVRDMKPPHESKSGVVY